MCIARQRVSFAQQHISAGSVALWWHACLHKGLGSVFTTKEEEREGGRGEGGKEVGRGEILLIDMP